MATYTRMTAPTDVNRPYVITVGLAHEDPEQPSYLPLDVIQAHQSWVSAKNTANERWLPGVFVEGTRSRTTTDQVVMFLGNASVLHQSDLDDADLVELLDELAAVLGTAAAQERVSVQFRDEAWVLEVDEEPE